MKKITLIASSLTAFMLLTGCTPALNNTQSSLYTNTNIYTINNSVENKSNTNYKDIQNDVYSDISLLMTPKVGLSYIHTKNRKLSYPIGYGGKRSFYLTQTIENPTITDKDIKKLRDNISDLFNDTTKAIIKNISTMKKAKDKNIYFYKSILLNQSINNMTFQQRFKDIVKEIDTYGLYIRVNNQTQQNTQDSTLNMIISSLTNDTNKLSSELSYSIYNGLKYSTLFVSSDMLNFYTDLNDTELNKEDPTAQVRLVTGILQVKDTLNFSVNNYTNIIKTSLVAKLENLNLDNKDEIIKQIALDIQNTYAQVKSAASASFTSNSKYKVYPLPKLLKGEEDSNITSIQNYVEAKKPWDDEHNSSWSTYRYIDVNVKNLKSWINPPKK